MMFHTAYNLDFKENEKGLTECDVTITKTFFKWVTSTEKLTMIFLDTCWIDKNTMAIIRNNYLAEIATNSAIYHSKKNETDFVKENKQKDNA